VAHGPEIFEGLIRDVLLELGYQVDRHATHHDDPGGLPRSPLGGSAPTALVRRPVRAARSGAH
jgi:hypothetical protein